MNTDYQYIQTIDLSDYTKRALYKKCLLVKLYDLKVCQLSARVTVTRGPPVTQTISETDYVNLEAKRF